jgi:hypothetical protein
MKLEAALVTLDRMLETSRLVGSNPVVEPSKLVGDLAVKLVAVADESVLVTATTTTELVGEDDSVDVGFVVSVNDVDVGFVVSVNNVDVGTEVSVGDKESVNFESVLVSKGRSVDVTLLRTDITELKMLERKLPVLVVSVGEAVKVLLGEFETVGVDESVVGTDDCAVVGADDSVEDPGVDVGSDESVLMLVTVTVGSADDGVAEAVDEMDKVSEVGVTEAGSEKVDVDVGGGGRSVVVRLPTMDVTPLRMLEIGSTVALAPLESVALAVKVPLGIELVGVSTVDVEDRLLLVGDGVGVTLSVIDTVVLVVEESVVLVEADSVDEESEVEELEVEELTVDEVASVGVDVAVLESVVYELESLAVVVADVELESVVEP